MKSPMSAVRTMAQAKAGTARLAPIETNPLRTAPLAVRFEQA